MEALRVLCQLKVPAFYLKIEMKFKIKKYLVLMLQVTAHCINRELLH